MAHLVKSITQLSDLCAVPLNSNNISTLKVKPLLKKLRDAREDIVNSLDIYLIVRRSVDSQNISLQIRRLINSLFRDFSFLFDVPKYNFNAPPALSVSDSAHDTDTGVPPSGRHNAAVSLS